MEYVAMVNTCTWAPSNGVGEVTAAPSQKLADHLASLDEQVELSKALKPILINAHSGCDLWDAETSRAYFTHALALEAKCGIKMCHETHRGRILYNPWVTRQMCKEFPSLKLTADLSHFCCVAERVFADTDEDWKTVMVEVVRATHHIHARVGCVGILYLFFYVKGSLAPFFLFCLIVLTSALLFPLYPASGTTKAPRSLTHVPQSTPPPLPPTKNGGMPSSRHRLRVATHG